MGQSVLAPTIGMEVHGSRHFPASAELWSELCDRGELLFGFPAQSSKPNNSYTPKCAEVGSSLPGQRHGVDFWLNQAGI